MLWLRQWSSPNRNIIREKNRQNLYSHCMGLSVVNNGNIGMQKRRWLQEKSRRHPNSTRLCGWSKYIDQVHFDVINFRQTQHTTTPSLDKIPGLVNRWSPKGLGTGKVCIDIRLISIKYWHCGRYILLRFISRSSLHPIKPRAEGHIYMGLTQSRSNVWLIWHFVCVVCGRMDGLLGYTKKTCTSSSISQGRY